MTELLAINTLVQVAVDDEHEFRSRVEDIEGAMITIAAPMGKGDVEVPPDGAYLDLRWACDRTRYLWRVQMTGQTRGRLRHWHVVGIGDPVRDNRRQYVRGEADGPATIITTDREHNERFDGHIIDVCEGGVRCRLSATDLNVGEAVTVQSTIAKNVMVLAGTVLSIRPAGSGKGLDVVVAYELPEHDAQMIRRYVLEWEISNRRRRMDLADLPVSAGRVRR